MGSERLANGGLAVRASEEALDAFVVALVGTGVAVRRLEQAVGPLEALFFALTGAGSEGSASTPAHHSPPHAPQNLERLADR